MSEPAGEGRRYSFTVRYNEPMLVDAVRTFVWRRVIVANRIFWMVTAMMAAMLVWSLATGESGWLVVVFAVGVAASVLIVAGVWYAHHANTIGTLRRMTTPEARITLSEEGLAVDTDLGSGTLPWSSITEVWERPGCWMVFTGKNQFTTWPTGPIPADVKQWAFDKLSGRDGRQGAGTSD